MCLDLVFRGSIIERYLGVRRTCSCSGTVIKEKLAFELYETVIASDEVEKEDYTVVLTGHSLDGGLAAMVSRMSGCTAVTINGADGVAIDKINEIIGEAPTDYRISNYITSPKNGKFSYRDIVQRMMFLVPGTRLTVMCIMPTVLRWIPIVRFPISFHNNDFTNPGLADPIN